MSVETMIKIASIILTPITGYLIQRMLFILSARVSNSESLFKAIQSNNTITAKETFERLYGKNILKTFRDIKEICQRDDFPEIIDLLKSNKGTIVFNNGKIQYRWKNLGCITNALSFILIAILTSINILLVVNTVNSEGKEAIAYLIIFAVFYTMSMFLYKPALDMIRMNRWMKNQN